MDRDRTSSNTSVRAEYRFFSLEAACSSQTSNEFDMWMENSLDAAQVSVSGAKLSIFFDLRVIDKQDRV